MGFKLREAKCMRSDTMTELRLRYGGFLLLFSVSMLSHKSGQVKLPMCAETDGHEWVLSGFTYHFIHKSKTIGRLVERPMHDTHEHISSVKRAQPGMQPCSYIGSIVVFSQSNTYKWSLEICRSFDTAYRKETPLKCSLMHCLRHFSELELRRRYSLYSLQAT